MTLESDPGKVSTIPLLATRFFSPPLPARYISRLRLLDRLEMALSAPVTLVSATAGFGKSLLVSEWMQKQSGLRSAWLSLEEADNDWGRFYRYLVAAWQHIFPQVGETALSEMASSPSFNREALSNILLNDLLVCQDANGDEHVLVVLDDYHHIRSNEIHETIVYLSEHLPRGCHLALLTRSDPPLPLARWRSHRALFELRADDLRFMPDEASEFLNQAMGLNLPGDQVEILEARTEGWIVGLQMAAVALQERLIHGDSDTQAYIRAFGGSQRYVLDYLLEEVISQQPEEIQQFLQSTAFLGQFCASLCDAVTGAAPPYSQNVLSRLIKANLFLIPLDDQNNWFRYHHLFADLLQNHLRQTAPERITSIYSQASSWYARNGLWSAALQYTLKLKDYGQAEKLFTEALIAGGIPFLFSGMRYIVSAIPAAALPGRPCLSLAKAVEMIEAGKMTGIENLLITAEADLQAQPQFTGQNDILAMIYLIQANTATILGDEAWIFSAAQKATRLLPRESQGNVEALFQIGVAFYYTGNLNRTVAAWEEALSLAIKHDFTHHILGCLNSLGRISCHAGELIRAETFFRRGQLLLRQEGVHSLRWQADIQRDYADLLRECNQLNEAHALMTACLPLLETWDLSGGFGLGLLHMGRICAAQGNISGAMAKLEQAEELSQSYYVFPDMRTLLHLFRVQLILASGDVQAAWRELETCQNSSYCQYELHREWALIAKAQVLLRTGRPSEALDLLEGRLKLALDNGRDRNWLQICLLTALALWARGEQAQAHRSLGEALVFAQGQGFKRIFVDEGEPMRELLEEYQVLFPQAQTSTYLSELLAIFPSELTLKAKNPQKHDILIEPLTERELEILGLVCQGLSNSEIAARLVLSVGTVKTHIHTIYGKLEVRDRPQAIAKAGLLGL